MDRTLGKEGSLTCGQLVDDKASSVLLDEPGFHIAVDEIKELGCSGMGVGGVHSTRSTNDPSCVSKGSRRRMTSKTYAMSPMAKAMPFAKSAGKLATFETVRFPPAAFVVPTPAL